MQRLIATLNIEQQLRKLEQTNFENKTIAFMTPALNENSEKIATDDPILLAIHELDVTSLMREVASRNDVNKTNVKLIENSDQINRGHGKCDYIIFVHKFTENEKNSVLETLGARNSDLKHIELF